MSMKVTRCEFAFGLTCKQVGECMAELEDENAKLRELLKDFYTDMWALGEWLEPYWQRMRELGVEVDV